jgi:hypothetical protein
MPTKLRLRRNLRWLDFFCKREVRRFGKIFFCVSVKNLSMSVSKGSVVLCCVFSESKKNTTQHNTDMPFYTDIDMSFRHVFKTQIARRLKTARKQFAQLKVGVGGQNFIWRKSCQGLENYRPALPQSNERNATNPRRRALGGSWPDSRIQRPLSGIPSQ